MILMIDNYDSFTYNIVQYLGELGAEVKVFRNDEITLEQIARLGPEKIVISPGPCAPDQAGISMDVIGEFAGKIPLLGVCLGHQSLGQVYGAKVVRARQVMHGKTSKIWHTGTGVFTGLTNPFVATRYHSLVVEKDSLPDCFEITAWTVLDEDPEEAGSGEGGGEIDEIMGLRHKETGVEGVQFHPESILTEHGHLLLRNFLEQKDCP
tara:strand:+ start:565 stop:1188 length:624 start_codon:yes stop_codon:yes gene_type:complete